MVQLGPPPAIVHFQPDRPLNQVMSSGIRPQMQVEAEALQRELKASVAHSTTLAERGQEQARRISSMEERTRETLRELAVNMGRKDGSEN